MTAIHRRKSLGHHRLFYRRAAGEELCYANAGGAFRIYFSAQ